MLSLGLGLWQGGAGAAAAAYQQLLDLATADGWTALWDPTNPDTRTLRNDGSNDYLSAVADGLGTLPDLAQGTAANQPQLSVGQFGELNAGLYDEASPSWLRTATFASVVTAPFFIVLVAKTNTITDQYYYADPDGGIGNSSVREDAGGVKLRNTNTDLVVKSRDTSSHVYGFLHHSAGTASEAYVDGSLVASGDIGGRDLARLIIGASNSVGQGFNGHQGVCGIYTGEPSATVRNDMFDKLHELTGIAKA